MRGREVSWGEPLSRRAGPVGAAVTNSGVRGALRLQRAVGNRAVAALLQRQDDDEPLTVAQVKKAIAFYNAQPDRYTPEILKLIQAKVGVAQTGVADATVVQGVAVW